MQNTTPGRMRRGWEVIVKDDPLYGRMTIGVKKLVNGQFYGNWREITNEHIRSVKVPYSDFVDMVADELIDKAELLVDGAIGEPMAVTGTSPSYTSGADISWHQTGDTTGTAGYTGGYLRYPQSAKWGDYEMPSFNPEVGVFKGVDVHISTNKENEMGSIKQDMYMFKMVAVCNVSYQVLAEAVVFARSENSANIKFALENKINPDEIGDTIDFYITYKAQLREPLDESKIQKVQVVE